MTDEQRTARLIRLGDSEQTFADPADDIRGFEAVDRDGEDLGRVVDLLVDEREGKVRMLQLEEGGVLGLGATSSFLPVEAVTSVVDDIVHVDPSRQTITRAPWYDPDLVEEPAQYADLYAHYGYAPFW